MRILLPLPQYDDKGLYDEYSPLLSKPLRVAFLLGLLIPLRGLFLLRASAKRASTLCSRLGVG